MLCTPKANGFADHYPFLNGYNWEYTLFSDKPIFFFMGTYDNFIGTLAFGTCQDVFEG